MLTNKPCSHQNSLIMDNCDENINSANAKPKFKPKLLTRIFKCFRRTSTSESSNYYLKQIFFMKRFHIFYLLITQMKL